MENNSADNIVNIRPSDRLSGVKEYYFSIKNKEIARLNAAGADIINLGIGSPDLPPSQEVIDAMCKCAVLPGSHGYQPYVGIPALRQGFSRFYKRHYGVDLDPDTQILPLMGSKEGIFHITLAITNPGDSVLVPNPGYPTYSSVSRIAGANVLSYPLVEENGWYPDVSTLDRLADEAEKAGAPVKLMWCNYPNMPTGAPAVPAKLAEIVAFARRRSILLCHDNPYSFILNDSPMSIFSIPGARDCCLELNSLSKSSNMPGWRVGMVAGRSDIISWVLNVRSNQDSGMFKGIQEAAIKALDAPDSWYDSINAIYRSRRVLAKRILEAAGCSVSAGQQGLFVWGRVLPGALPAVAADDSEGPVSRKVSDLVLGRCRVFLTPGMIFGDVGDNYMRVSLCASEERMKEALERIAQARIQTE